MRAGQTRPNCASVKAPRDSVLRIVYLTTGWVLVLVITPIVGVLPGPGGIFIFAFGAALLLKNSNWVKRAYVRHSRRHPGHARFGDKVLRRPKAPRGRARLEVVGDVKMSLKARVRSLVDFFAGRS